MTPLDWVIVAFAVLMAAVGWRQGFIAGALALAGFAAGALLGSRLGPIVLPDGSSSPYAPLFALAGGLLGGSLLAGLLEGAGFALRSRLRAPGLAVVDGGLGAMLSAAIALGLAWIAGAVMLQTPGARELRRDIQRSEILRRLNAVLPPSGPLLNALARVDPFPRVDGPEADVPAPRAAIARDPEVAGAAASVVRILGTACGLGVEGSGWVAGDGLVVTNAHVVAGQDDTVVEVRGREPRLDAVAVAFDATNDVAVLRVDGLDAPRLELAADPAAGTAAGILGFPQNGPYAVRAGRLGQTRDVVSQDAYGRGPVTRRITSFRGVVKPGNSGGPMVDGDGRVVTTVFAASRGAATAGGYGVPNREVRRALEGAAPPGRAVGTGPCTR
ncbi:MAG: MarP family serine protease [Solirubrobacterales bacterium]|nr:MarP family serine protease [Solirubrobacterales bacterium]